MDLSKLREQIDEIDGKIVELYQRRMDVSREVAEYKIATGRNVLDRHRELEKLAKVRALAHGEFNARGLSRSCP